MSGDETEHKSSYFFHKCLKDILRTSEKGPLFSLAENESQDDTDKPPLSSKPGPSSTTASGKTCTESSEKNKKPKLLDLRSWKENFFFSSNDDRLKDGVMFFKYFKSENNLQFNDVRKKLKQSIRHKMLKRRSLAVKRKFNKRNFKRFMYKKTK